MVQTLTEKTMRRVKRVYLMRRALHPTLCKVYFTAALFSVTMFYVSLGSIWTNMPPLFDFAALYEFFTVAFSVTERSVQFVLLALTISAAALLTDMLRHLVRLVATSRLALGQW